MTILRGSIPTKNHLLSVCVRLFLEQGYKQTTVRQIASEAGVSVSSFQNFFGSKDGVLGELIAFMFGGQFGAARDIVGAELPPVYICRRDRDTARAYRAQRESARYLP